MPRAKKPKKSEKVEIKDGEVVVSIGVTVPGRMQFSSRKMDVSIRTSIQPGETHDKTLDRVKKAIYGELKKAELEFKDLTNTIIIGGK